MTEAKVFKLKDYGYDGLGTLDSVAGDPFDLREGDSVEVVVRADYDALLERLKGLEADARRYVWLRSKGAWKHSDPVGEPDGISVYWEYCSDDDNGNDPRVDAIIDAQIARE